MPSMESDRETVAQKRRKSVSDLAGGIPPLHRGGRAQTRSKNDSDEIDDLIAKVSKPSKSFGADRDEARIGKEKLRLQRKDSGRERRDSSSRSLNSIFSDESSRSLLDRSIPSRSFTHPDLFFEDEEKNYESKSPERQNSFASDASSSRSLLLHQGSSNSVLTRGSSILSEGSSRSLNHGGSSRSLDSSSSAANSSSTGPLREKSGRKSRGSSRDWAVTIKGVKPSKDDHPNQDVHLILPKFQREEVGMYAIFDGHGKHGAGVARFCSKTIQERLKKLKAAERVWTSPDMAHKVFSKSFLHTSKMLSLSRIDISYSGCTATVVLYDRASGMLAFANVGDSRVVLASEEHGTRLVARDLTNDHSPLHEEEMERIIEHGGQVSQPSVDQRGKIVEPARVWLPSGRAPGLAMSRSLGDSVAHTIGVTCDPGVSLYQTTASDLFLIVASDGVWQQMSSQQAVNLISKSPASVKSESFDIKTAAEALAQESMARWQALSPDGVTDDVTCIVIKLF